MKIANSVEGVEGENSVAYDVEGLEKANAVADTKVADAVEGTYAVEGVLQADAMNAHAMNANACNEDAFVCIVCIALSHPLLFFLK